MSAVDYVVVPDFFPAEWVESDDDESGILVLLKKNKRIAEFVITRLPRVPGDVVYQTFTVTITEKVKASELHGRVETRPGDEWHGQAMITDNWSASRMNPGDTLIIYGDFRVIW